MSTEHVAPPTRAEWVDSMLRKAILTGELLPGEKLYAERLAEQWGVSPTPLRETFQRLAGEGLVVIEPQRGARVAPLSVEEAVEVYELRQLLDPEALRRSMHAAGDDPTYVDAVDDAYERLARRHRSFADFHDAHRAFHVALVARCPNQRLVRQVTQLLDQSQRFQAVGRGTAGMRGAAAETEHRELRDAVKAGDTRTAVAVLRRHLTGTLDAVRNSEENPR